MVGVEDDRDAVGRSNGTDVMSSSNATLDGSALVLVVDALTAEVSSTALGDLKDDGGLGVASSLERGDHGGGAGDVNGGDGVLLLLRVLEELWKRKSAF